MTIGIDLRGCGEVEFQNVYVSNMDVGMLADDSGTLQGSNGRFVNCKKSISARRVGKASLSDIEVTQDHGSHPNPKQFESAGGKYKEFLMHTSAIASIVGFIWSVAGF